jgi:formate hydrogenlyase transcriptional activator
MEKVLPPRLVVAAREDEKTILLALSNEIAGIRNRNDFFEVVKAKLKIIFDVEGFGISHISRDRKTYRAFISEHQEKVRENSSFKDLARETYDIDDRVYRVVLMSEEPVLFQIDELVTQSDVPGYINFLQKIGIRQLLMVPLRVGGETIGTVNFLLEGNSVIIRKPSLLKSVCAQLAVKVSNILANEMVLEQLAEIQRYKRQLEEEKIYLQEEIRTTNNYSEIIGESAAIKKVFRLVTQVAYSDSTVLLLGETGTGKELIARAIHNNSMRKSKLMVKVNCTALPPNLIESELFGHERGSFTGAFERRIGKFELANNGTLFLDEIGEMPPGLQVKLLRALQEKEIERVGGKTIIKTDVRIIAATNRDLDKLMEEGKFRSDLYYRLNIFPILLPPLRDRREDIPQLASYFILRYAKKAGKAIHTIHHNVLQELMQYHWPGNIRELENLIERSVLLTDGDSIKDIPLPHHKNDPAQMPESEKTGIRTIAENEKDHILKVLRQVKGKVGGEDGAARLLGVPPSTLTSKMKRLGIRKEHF